MRNADEVLAQTLPARRAQGRYFTPAPLAAYLVEQAADLVPPGPLAVVDPACGAGALLAPAAAAWPRASLWGLELSAAAAAAARRRVPTATILEGNALEKGGDELAARIPPNAFQLWLANPPYNGTSPVLRNPTRYAELQRWLPTSLAKGLSLRDDYAFFLLLARRRLLGRRGAVAFITSASLLDSFAYAPLREALLESFALERVVELGRGVFADTQVRTCVTLWSSPRRPSRPVHRGRGVGGAFAKDQLSAAAPLRPRAPEWLLRPTSRRAEALDAEWRERGQALRELIPVSFPGLKTRFDELLVDDDADRLLRRVDAFLGATPRSLARFAKTWGIPERCQAKLESLQASLAGARLRAEPERIRPYLRYAGAKHRGVIPASASAFCYLDRRLIPRGDHRLHGAYDPHACATKLVFNARELPLSAAFVDAPACVHDHQHARFAPLWVPEQLLGANLRAAVRAPLGPDAPNLSPRGRAWAAALGSPAAVFRAVCDFINSEPVQEVWAPAFGASRDLCVPVPYGS